MLRSQGSLPELYSTGTRLDIDLPEGSTVRTILDLRNFHAYQRTRGPQAMLLELYMYREAEKFELTDRREHGSGDDISLSASGYMYSTMHIAFSLYLAWVDADGIQRR